MTPHAAIAQLALYEWPEPEVLLRFGGIWLGVFFAALVAGLIASLVIVRLVRTVVSKTRTKVDDVFVEHEVMQRLARVVPALVIHSAAPLLFPEGSSYVEVVQRLANVWMILAAGRALRHKYLPRAPGAGAVGG